MLGRLLTAAAVGRSFPPLMTGFTDGVSLETLRREQASFVEERDWAQFHTPRSLALALVGEVGEVCELLQWRGDDGATPGLPDWSDAERVALADELADVLSYVIRLSDVADIDLSDAFLQKLQKNQDKYPAEMVRGSAKKYTEYRTSARVAAASAVAEAVAASDAEDDYPRVAQAADAGAVSTEEGASVGFESGGWGTPQRVSDAYERAMARVYGESGVTSESAEKEAEEPSPAEPPPTTAPTTDDTLEQLEPAPPRPSPAQRAAKKVEADQARFEAKVAELQADQEVAAARYEAAVQEMERRRRLVYGEPEPEPDPELEPEPEPEAEPEPEPELEPSLELQKEAQEQQAASGEVEVESLDDLWGLMEFGGPNDLM